MHGQSPQAGPKASRIGWTVAWVAVVLLCVGAPASALAEGDTDGTSRSLSQIGLPGWLDQPLSLELAAADADPLAASPAPGGGEESKPAPEAGEAPTKGPPLPLYTVEGTGGGLIVPMAYLVNAGPGAGPGAGYTFVKIGKKTIHQVAVTQTFLGRIEVGYSLVTLDLGDFPNDVQKHTGVDIDFSHIVQHNFSLRGLLVEENTGSPLMPAITGGVTFKYTPAVQEIDRRLRGGVRALGMARNNGTDFTLHASKTIPNVVCGRPVMLTGGLRFSQAAQLGLLGYGDAYRLTGEGNIAVMATDWLAIGYEFRQKKNPYRTLGRLVGEEDNWHTILVAFILNPRLVVACGWGHFGNMVNHNEPGVWGLHVKYEF